MKLEKVENPIIALTQDWPMKLEDIYWILVPIVFYILFK